MTAVSAPSALSRSGFGQEKCSAGEITDRPQWGSGRVALVMLTTKCADLSSDETDSDRGEDKEWILRCRVVMTHGVTGEVRVPCRCNSYDKCLFFIFNHHLHDQDKYDVRIEWKMVHKDEA